MNRHPVRLPVVLAAVLACIIAPLRLPAGPLAAEGKRGEAEKKSPAGDKKKEEPKEEAKKAAAETPSAPGGDLVAWGTIKEVKGTEFFTLDYTRVSGRKASKHSAFLKVAEDAEFYRDKTVKVTDLKEGDKIWILGRPVEADVTDPTGGQHIDRQFANVTVIAGGEGLEVNREYKDPRDPKTVWCQATIAKAGASISAKHEGETYKVALGKSAQVFMREKGGDAKSLKSGVQIEVTADKGDGRPETKSAADAKKESFVAKRVVLLDRRLSPVVYPVLIP